MNQPKSFRAHRAWLLTVLLSISTNSALAQGPPPDQVDSPRPQGWIVDQADVLRPEQQARINSRITLLEKQTGTELAVVTLPDTDGRDPKPYATALFKRWGIGKAGKNNGLLFLVVINRRRMEVEVGDGLRGPMPDRWVETTLKQVAVPFFRAGQPGNGIEHTVEQLIERVPCDTGSGLHHDLGALWPEYATQYLDDLVSRHDIELHVEKRAQPSRAQAEKRARQLKLGPRGWLIHVSPTTGQLVSTGWQPPNPLPTRLPGKTPGERIAFLQQALQQQFAPAQPPAPPPGSDPPHARPAPLLSSSPADSSDSPLPSWLLTPLLACGGLFGVYQWAKYRRPRTCPHCRTRLHLLSEAEEDAYLAPDEQVEEQLGSMDHQVWICHGCEYRTQEAWSAWLSSYKSCPGCSRRTLSSRNETIVSATYDNSGQGRTTRNCQNCSFYDQSYYTIAQLTRSSDSSSSSSSDSGFSSSYDSGSSSSSGFGGGDSSGGGGGASW